MAKRVVICGGSGFVGGAVKAHLESNGYEAVVVSRNPGPKEVSWDRLTQVLEDSDAVVNLAGRSIVCKFSTENRKQILESRINSTNQVAVALDKCIHPPAKWINASAVGFYGSRGDEVLTEASPAGTGFMSEVCQPWEAACLDADAPAEKIILRIGLVFSSKGGALKSLINLTKSFLGGQAGNGEQWVAWIALPDLAKMIQWAIENETEEVINACAPNPIKNRDLMAWLRKSLGRPWAPAVPAIVLDLIGKTIGPDSALLLNSSRVIPQNAGAFEFDFPTLENVKLSEI